MRKILIVDDEPMMLKLVERILRPHYQTICAESGKKALELFVRDSPDMVLSDLHMPEMDGYELHRLLQENNDEPVPVMFMTTDNSESSEIRGFDAGAADYVQKPLKEDALLRRIENILKNNDKIRGLKQAADIDPLTKLLNKGAARREIDALIKNVSGCLLMIDLDSFKLVNDIYGHGMGDRILVRLAELLRSITRSDDCIGRIGGDEFILFARRVHTKEVISSKINYINEELLRSACEYMGDDMSIPLGVSVGGAFVPSDGTDFDELSHKADEALYRVKQNGKHGVAMYDRRQSDDANAKAQSLPVIRRILAERETPAEAFLLDTERFTAVYRFRIRQKSENPGDKPDTMLIRFMLHPHLCADNAGDSLIEEKAMQFQSFLLKELKPDDCFTRYGKTQFLALTQAAPDKEQNILSAWALLPEAFDCSCACDSEIF